MADAPHTSDPGPAGRPGNSAAGHDPSNEYLKDFVSGKRVRATPEQTQAVQVFARRLVEDYGYRKEQVQTQPQHRVRARPSDASRSFPVDIGVFKGTGRAEADLVMIVECKRNTKRDGESQLRLYMDMSAAEVGVWFNGDDHLYLRKVHHPDGRRTYQALPNIPRQGQRIEDIGLYTRAALVPPSNLKAVFRDIRNHLAGMTTGITRDEALAQEIINLLFCKLLDEQESAPEDVVQFRAGVGEGCQEVAARVAALFERVKAHVFGDVFEATERIRLDADSVAYVVGELQTYTIVEAGRDAIGEAFEVFIGPALRGAEGQFFTPRNVIEMMVRMVGPQPGEKIIDPACGSGGFLIAALAHVWGQLREQAAHRNWSERQLAKREYEVAAECFRGIDKDAFLAKVCKAYMALVGDGRGGVFCQNALEPFADWSPLVREEAVPGTFDVVLTNPPFGKKIVVKGEATIGQFELGRKWRRSGGEPAWEQTTALRAQLPPQIPFLERCVALLKPGGRLGIVLPESLFGNPSHGYVVQWLRSHLRITAIVNMPEPLFKTSGKGGTHTKVCVLIATRRGDNQAPDAPIFMAEAHWCGHDSRGNPTVRLLPNGESELLDEVPEIASRFDDWQRVLGGEREEGTPRKKGALSGGARGDTPRKQGAPERFAPDHRGFSLSPADVVGGVFIPRYYNPDIANEMRRLSPEFRFPTLGELEAEGAVSFATGVEVGKMAYGTGRIPFIRTSDISNWEIKADFKHGVSPQLYERYRDQADVAAGDILMVKDGTYLIGTTAMVTRWDLPMLFQSHLYRIRIRRPKRIAPWLLFALLNTPIVRLQVRAKRFTQDIIDTIGRRVLEIAIPVPRCEANARRLAADFKRRIETRIRLRHEASNLVRSVGAVAVAPGVEDVEI